MGSARAHITSIPRRPAEDLARAHNLVIFVPRATLSAKANVAAFVEMCRTRLTVLGADLDFDNPCWDVTKATRRRGSSARDHIYFVRNGPGRTLSDTPLAEPFGAFARAFIRYEHGLRPKTTFAFWMSALRALEHGLRTRNARPEVHRTDHEVLQAAVDYLLGRLDALAAYKVTNFLQHISAFLDEHLLVPVANQWRNPVPRPQQGPRIGAAYEARRRKRLPSRDALEGLADAFHRATAPADVIVVSVAGLQLAANPRICETMTLPSNARVELLREGQEEGHAIRWWPAKRNQPRMKWLVSSLVPIAKQALEKIQAITEPWRRVARWYERHPTEVFLPPGLEHLRGREFISIEEANAVLGGTRAARAFRGRPFVYQGGRKCFRFEDMQAFALSMLPDDFPVFDRVSGLRFSEALLVVPRGLLSQPGIAPMPCMIERVSSQHMRAGLGCRPASACSVFKRLGITAEDGSPIRLNPHSIRHYMSDLVDRNALSEVDQARWAGRTPAQNRHYQHMSDAERVDRLRAAYSQGEKRITDSSLSLQAPVPRTDAALTLTPMVLPTEIGYCLHDTLMMPCQLHRDCLFCPEHVCVKGDAHRTSVVRRWLSEHVTLLARAERSMSREDLGADRWVEHCRLAVERMRDLLALLEDPAVADGTLVRLTVGPGPSRIRLAAEGRGLMPSKPESKNWKHLLEPPHART